MFYTSSDRVTDDLISFYDSLHTFSGNCGWLRSIQDKPDPHDYGRKIWHNRNLWYRTVEGSWLIVGSGKVSAHTKTNAEYCFLGIPYSSFVRITHYTRNAVDCYPDTTQTSKDGTGFSQQFLTDFGNHSLFFPDSRHKHCRQHYGNWYDSSVSSCSFSGFY